MSLHTAEARIPANLESGDIKSQPVKNGPNINASSDVVHATQTFETEPLDIVEKSEKARVLKHEHIQTTFDLDEEYLQSFSRSISVAAKRITMVAETLIGLAVPQSIFVCELYGKRNWPNVPPSTALKSSSLGALVFIGLTIVFIFKCARTLYKAANEVNTVRTTKFKLCADALSALQSHQLPGGKCCNIPDDLRRILYIGGKRGFYDTLSTLLFAFSMMSVIGTIFGFMVTTRRDAVWAPRWLAFCITMMLWFLVDQLVLYNPYVSAKISFMRGRKKIPSALVTVP